MRLVVKISNPFVGIAEKVTFNNVEHTEVTRLNEGCEQYMIIHCYTNPNQSREEEKPNVECSDAILQLIRGGIPGGDYTIFFIAKKYISLEDFRIVEDI